MDLLSAEKIAPEPLFPICFEKIPVARRVEASAKSLRRAAEFAEREQQQTTDRLERTAAKYYAQQPAEETHSGREPLQRIHAKASCRAAPGAAKSRRAL